MTKEPSYFSLDTLKIWTLGGLEGTVVGILMVVIVACIGMSIFLTKVEPDKKDTIYISWIFTGFLGVIFTILILETVYVNNKTNWEESNAISYIEQEDPIIEDVFNHLELTSNTRAEVVIEVEGRPRTITAEIYLKEGVDKPYVEYKLIKEDLSKNYFKGVVYEPKLYLPKDFKYGKTELEW